MPKARKSLILKDQPSVYHCMSRCVRRSYLCGSDSVTNNNYDHRKAWVRERIKQLSKIFSMEVYSYAVMCNHVHIVIATNPDAAELWTGSEVIERWHKLTVASQNKEGRFLPLSKDRLEARSADKALVEKLRERLKCLSHFMQYLNQYIARQANDEDKCKGRFWEGRFKSQRLVDEGAVLACMAYVELNPVRAGIVDRPELSEFTSVYDRIVAKRAKDNLKEISGEQIRHKSKEQQVILQKMRRDKDKDDWLQPVCQKKGSLMPDIDLENYLRLIDWTGRTLKVGKRGHIPEDLAPILERLDLEKEEWVNNVKKFGGMFYHIIGKASSLAKAAERAGQRWAKGMQSSKKLFQQFKSPLVRVTGN